MKPGGASPVPEPEYVDEILPEHLPSGELSIAVFGPGEGEAIVVRLPDGAVGVVDGCREPERDHPKGRGDPVRELLEKLAALAPEPEKFRLEFVCLTHPHADHYRGLGRLLEAFLGKVSRIWTVTHVQPHFAEALIKWTDVITRGKARDDEVRAGLIRVLARFDEAKSHSAKGLRHLSSHTRLLRREILGRILRIHACGPASGDLDTAQKQLVASLTAVSGKKSSRTHDPNLTSGALLVRWGDAGVLLGGDLLLGRGQNSGWRLARSQIRGKVQVVNVAHHASREAHDAVLWKKMAPDLAIVTPFKGGVGSNPPRPAQINLLAGTAVVAITSPPDWGADPVRPLPIRPILPRSFAPKGKSLRSTVASGAFSDRRNAVAVSLDATGKITRFVLAGKADVYLPPPPPPKAP